jgi:uncharacterized membrane protein
VTALLLAAAAFLVTHFVSSTPLRAALVKGMGEWPYRGAYSAVAFATLGWMVWAYTQAPSTFLWVWWRDAPYVAMPIALVLIACGYWRNPTMVGADKLLKSDDPARGMIRVTRHPIMWGVMLWAAAHIVAGGDVKGLIFFGCLLLVALVGTISMDRRKRANPDWPRFAAVTSHIPFVAIAQGRNRLVWREIGWLRPAIGIAVFFAILTFHP